jgi:hypothetical protein
MARNVLDAHSKDVLDVYIEVKSNIIGALRSRSSGSEGQHKAYVLHQIEDSKVINDKVGNKSIVLFSLYSRMVRVYNPIINGQTLNFQYDVSTNNIFDK